MCSMYVKYLTEVYPDYSILHYKLAVYMTVYAICKYILQPTLLNGFVNWEVWHKYNLGILYNYPIIIGE